MEDFTIKTGEADKEEAAEVIERITSDLYGDDAIVSQDLKDYIRIRVRGQDTEVRVSEESGITEIDYLRANDEVTERIKGLFEGSTQHTPSPDTTSETDDVSHSAGTEIGPVFKPKSKEQVGYTPASESTRRDTGKICENCAHYDNHGNCHIVPDIDPKGYCTKEYADVGIYGVGSHVEGEETKLTIKKWGENFQRAFEGNAIETFVTKARKAMEKRLDKGGGSGNRKDPWVEMRENELEAHSYKNATDGWLNVRTDAEVIVFRVEGTGYEDVTEKSWGVQHPFTERDDDNVHFADGRAEAIEFAKQWMNREYEPDDTY